MTIRTNRFGVVRAEETRDDLYAAIDVSCDKVSRSLKRVKEKAVARGNWPGRGAAKGGVAIGDVLPPDTDLDSEVSEDEYELATQNLDIPESVKKTKVFYLDAMSMQARPLALPSADSGLCCAMALTPRASALAATGSLRVCSQSYMCASALAPLYSAEHAQTSGGSRPHLRCRGPVDASSGRKPCARACALAPPVASLPLPRAVICPCLLYTSPSPRD